MIPGFDHDSIGLALTYPQVSLPMSELVESLNAGVVTSLVGCQGFLSSAWFFLVPFGSVSSGSIVQAGSLLIIRRDVGFGFSPVRYDWCRSFFGCHGPITIESIANDCVFLLGFLKMMAFLLVSLGFYPKRHSQIDR